MRKPLENVLVMRRLQNLVGLGNTFNLRQTICGNLDYIPLEMIKTTEELFEFRVSRFIYIVQVENVEYDASVDIWSLGILFSYEILNGVLWSLGILFGYGILNGFLSLKQKSTSYRRFKVPSKACYFCIIKGAVDFEFED